MATASAQIQWGDVATWVGGIATAVALLLTYGLLRITRREQRELQAEKRQAQARLVSAWSSEVKQASGGTAHSVTVILQNSSDEPIYGVRVAVGSQWQATNIDHSEVDLVYVIPPKSRLERKTSLELSLVAERAESSLPVEILFSDAAARYWHRDRYGELTQIAKNLPPAGDKYFFKQTVGNRRSD